jgi:hypothetical protein
MSHAVYFNLMRFWCWLCYRAYMASPVAMSHSTRYGLFQMWLLGYAGAYAHSTRADFHLCDFFYHTRAEQSAAWDRHLAALGGAAT